MNPQAITVGLFVIAVICGGVAFYKSSNLGDQMHGLGNFMIRLTFGICVFLAVWVCSTYALWLNGVQLAIGTIEQGNMSEQWWLGPVCIVWAVMAYVTLRKS